MLNIVTIDNSEEDDLRRGFMQWELLEQPWGPLKPFIEVFLSYLIVTGPFILVALTINSLLAKCVKKEWVFALAKMLGHIRIFRYMLIPFVSLFALTNPSCYETGKFMKEEHKPSFYDASVSFCHPITGLFPYSNSGELFFFLGMLYPIIKLDLPLWQFGLGYLLAGFLIIFLRGTVTELLTERFLKHNQ
jgi:PTS system glucitol/sorbitol-specific IIC component